MNSSWSKKNYCENTLYMAKKLISFYCICPFKKILSFFCKCENKNSWNFKFSGLKFYYIKTTWKSKTRVTSSKPRVMISNPRVTSSDLRVTSSNPRVTSSNSQVRRIKTRVAS